MADMLNIRLQRSARQERRAGVPLGPMATPPRKTLLEPGHEAEWAALNAEKRRALTPPPETPVAELLRRGQHLSAQAAALLRAMERARDDT